MSILRPLIVLLAVLILPACQGFPKSGPSAKVIAKEAVVTRSTEQDYKLPYAFVDLTPTVLALFDQPEGLATRSSFGMSGAAPRRVLGVGDVIDVTIFESGAGGLFVPAEAGSRPGNFVALPRQTVDSSGRITVPYAGTLQVAGLTASAAQALVVRRLAGKALDPQVVLSVVESRSYEVSVLGDVNTAGRLPISANGERILDAISRAGGITTPAKEMYVTLQRGGRNATVSFQNLIANPSSNIFVKPGDVILVSRDRRTYLAFGASGQNGRFDFENSNLTLAEAIAQAGGLLDDRAEPSAAFLYRDVKAAKAARLGVPMAKGQPSFPVIFRVDLRDPTMYFLAQDFYMRDKDILYIDNAKAVSVLKVLNVVNGVTSSTVGAVSDVRRVSTN